MIFRSTYNKPVLLVGNGVRFGNAEKMVREYAKKTNIPVLTTMNGVDLAQDDLHIGFIGTHGNRVANLILNECDLVIAVGARLGIRQVGRNPKNFAPNADLIRADIDEYELSRDIKVGEKKYHTDSRDFMRLLFEEDDVDFSGWKDKCMAAKEALDEYDAEEGNLAVRKISDLLQPNPIVAVDVGQNQCWAAQSLHLKGYEGRIHIGGGYGTMGCALPYAIGSCIATNRGRVFCITGDGGLQMNIQELETIKREKLPIKIFVLNNKVLGKISETQYKDNNGRFAQTTADSGYSVPDFERIAYAYGIKAVTLARYQMIEDYSSWFSDDEACLFNIMLPKESFLVPKIKWETGIMSPILSEDIIDRVLKLLR